MKPVILVASDLRENESCIGLRRQYLMSITRAGGLPIMIPIDAEDCDWAWLFERADGLLITGGADVDPARYGEAKRPSCGEILAERERMDFYFARRAREAKMPVLGICRGCQVMAVDGGGAMWQDIPTDLGIPNERHSQTAPYEVTTHSVDVEPDSLLARVTGCSGKRAMQTNSHHHQCVKSLGPDDRLEAVCSEDGVYEGFSSKTLPFWLGVQWHPEMLSAAHPEAQALFNALVKAAGEFARTKSAR